MSETTAEEWRPVVGWPGYSVSNIGRIASTRFRNKQTSRAQWRVLRPWLSLGYIRVELRDKERIKSFPVHRLVLEAFVGPCPPDKLETGHLNGKSRDNRVANLAWVTRAENVAHKVLHGTAYGGPNHHPAAAFSGVAAINASRVVCVRGHDALVTTPRYGAKGVRRSCVACHREYDQGVRRT